LLIQNEKKDKKNSKIKILELGERIFFEKLQIQKKGSIKENKCM